MRQGPPEPRHDPATPVIGIRFIAASLAVPLIVALAIGEASTGAPAAQSAAAGYPIVAGYEHLRSANFADEAAMGEVLLGELNCLSCHALADPARNGIADRITTKPAPDLSEVGRRVTRAWLASYLNDPGGLKPGSTMPDLFAASSLEEREFLVERITHFLLSQGGEMDTLDHRPFRFRATVERGRELFHAVGCVACHEPEDATAAPAAPSVPLPDLADKTSVSALADFLLEPNRFRHGGRMPSLYLTEEEVTDIAVYLLRAQEPEVVAQVAGFEFEYFLDPMPDEDAEGFFSRPPPAYDELTPEGTGHVAVLSLQLPIRTRRGNHLFRFGAVLPIEQSGTYTFVLSSDRRSGSELLVDGQAIATKNRDTGREITTDIELTAGNHGVEVTYYIRGDTGEPYLEATIEGGAITEPMPIDRLAVFEDVRLAPRTDAAFEPDPIRASEGRRLFRELGCSSCHALSTATAGAALLYPAPPLEQLDPSVLAANNEIHAAKGSPRYNLAAHQKRAIGAALSALDDIVLPRDADAQVVHALATYNCYACHQRNGGNGIVGGPDEVRDLYFMVTPGLGLDLGDEGRVPPTLTAVGGKLKPPALQSILREDRLHVRRNFMETRMPRFGGALLDTLAAALDAADATAGDLVEPPFSRQAVEDGRTLAGDRGMRCITCHEIGVNAAQGVSTVNLSSSFDRLRPGWVARYLRDPHSLREGTRMPSFWAGGSVIHPDIADGTVGGQIDAVYSYLSLGVSMPVPDGANIGDTMVLTPMDEPLVFRTFMADASPRAILVGYPESVHVGFDANVLRLAKAWRGGFYDAQGTWSGRAGRFLDPYGAEIINMPPGPALAFLDGVDDPWPAVTMTDRNVGGRFMGYRLDEQSRPIFMYRLDDIVVEEQPIPVVSPGGANLTRRFSLEAGQVSEDLYLLVAEGDEIRQNDDGTWSIDDSVTVALRSSTPMTPFVRTSQGVQQLLLPVGIGSNQTVSIDVEISW